MENDHKINWKGAEEEFSLELCKDYKKSQRLLGFRKYGPMDVILGKNKVWKKVKKTHTFISMLLVVQF